MLVKDFTSKGVLLKCELRANKLRVYHMVSQRVESITLQVASCESTSLPVASQQAGIYCPVVRCKFRRSSL